MTLSLFERGKAWSSCCAALLACSAVSPQEPPVLRPDVVRRDVRANATCASDQAAAVVSLAPDGAVAVAWVSRRQLDGYDAVCLQRYDRSGARAGREALAWAAAGHQQSAPALAHAGDDLWVAWSSFGPAEGRRAYLHRVGGEAEPFALGGRGARDVALASVGGGLLAVWVEDGRVLAQPFDPSGPAGEPAALSPEGQDAALPAVAALAGGGAVVVWASAGEDPAGLRARLLGEAGEPEAEPFELAGSGGRGDIEPSVAALPGGGFAVAWLRARPADGYDVMAAAFRRDGEPLFAPRRIDAGGKELSGATVAAARDGRICVAWNCGRYADSGFDVDVLGRWVDDSGAFAGEPFALTGHRDGPQRLIAATNRRALACGPDGELVAAWSGDGGLGDPKAAHLTWSMPAEGPAAQRLCAAGPAAPPPPPLAEVAPLRTGVVHDSTLAVTDRPIFVGARAQTRGAENPLDGSGFEAITDTGWLPPDPHVAVGPEHAVAIVNGGIAFFQKDGTRTFFADINGSSGFWGALGAGGFVFDPRVLFDMNSGRFLAMAAEHAGARGYFDLAVSDDDDPNGTWFKYRFDLTQQIGTYFIDFPHIGVDERAVYISGNVFGGNTSHVLYVLDKQALLVGQAVTPKVVKNGNLDSAGLGAQIGPSAAGYMVQARNSTSFRIFAITDPLTNPQLVQADVSVPFHTSPASAPQQGTSVRFSTVDRRVSTIAFINGRIYCAHNADNPVRARWYEFEVGDWPNSGPPPSLVQSGAVVTEGASTFLPSIAADNHGNVLICCAKSSPAEYVSTAYFYRFAGDPPGTTRGPFVAKASASSYTANSRWGDYSGAGLDPRDRATFWFIHEWAASRFSWSTWIEAQRFQPPTLTASSATLSAATGGPLVLDLDNPPFAGRAYVVLGSASGTSPGFRLPGHPGIVNLDLNIDGFTLGMIQALNTPMFENFSGTLDAGGRATATFNLPALPVLAGTDLWFAYAQDGNPWEFASETVQVSIVP